ncbi:hypothetical protein HDC92_004355 [Pedobacter sp. AK017]|uniref:hypothetical protein n=1 Tax=Pedobacter sp. AK017 TaxID=2723073 RepID=UPI00160CC0FA|nr:hypothetical protein [Pedobacter sp. AK017]MBB5440652.1 hypothetical protein [Pedobacter sp. AK017]
MEELFNPDQQNLEDKLRLLADGEEAGLTPAEAAIYGIDYADEDPNDEDPEDESEEDEDE